MDNNEATAWRQRVQRARARAGWTQNDLAEEAGVSPGTIKGLERNHDPRTPHATNRLKIEEALAEWWQDGVGDLAERIAEEKDDPPNSEESQPNDVDVVLQVVRYALEGLEGQERRDRIDAIMRAALGLPTVGG